MSKELNKKAVIYCRVSTKEQADSGTSLGAQENSCNLFCERNNIEVAKVFIEQGESAKTADRTQLKKMFEYCKKNYKELDLVLVYKIDRLSRDVNDYLLLKGQYLALKMQVRSVTENLEDSPSGRFMETVLAGQAQFDNEIRGERCKNGMIEAVKKGRFVWVAPVGYINGKVNGFPNLEIDEKRAELVARIFELIASDKYHQEEVRAIITKEGLRLRSGKKLSRSYFNKLAKNKIYTGYIEKFGLCEKGDFEPIIDLDLFNRAQAVLERRGHKKHRYLTNNPDFPLRGLVLSAEGNKFTGSWSRGRNGRFPYYRPIGENGLNIKRDDLESKFNEWLSDYEFNNRVKKLLEEAIKVNWQDRQNDNVKTKKRLERKLNELERKEELVVEKNLKGVIPDTIANKQLSKIEEERFNIKSEIEKYQEQEDSIDDVLKKSFRFLKNINKELGEVEFYKRQKLQWFLFPEGVVYENENFRTAKTALILQTKKTLANKESSLVGQGGFEPPTPTL